jgi:arylsulfatase A-like enzyme
MTLPSLTSILTGVDPTTHGLRDNGLFVLGPEATLVSEVLNRHGWLTAALVGSYVLDARFGLQRGFETYGGIPGGGMGDRRFECTADEVVDDALRWRAPLPSDAAFFVWVHLYDPHFPYRPPRPRDERAQHPYDGEIAFCDAQIARLLSFLEDGKRNLITVVTADHGEALGDHGERRHGTFVYQPTLHVPLVLSGEAVGSWKGQRVAHAVSTVDLAPTLLGLAGIPAAALPAVGTRLLLPPDEAAQPRAIYFENFFPYYSHRWSAMRGLVWGDHKLIEVPSPEFYSLRTGPTERNDLARDDSARLGEMQRRMREFLARKPAQPWDARADLQPTDGDLLEALGYASGSFDDGNPFDSRLPGIRERIGDLDLLREAAREPLLQMRAANPEDPTARVRLSKVELALGNHEAAIPLLKHVVRDQGHVLANRYNLALAYTD